MKRDKNHRKFINSLPCATCNALSPSQCSHIRRNTDCGVGLKPSDKFSVPQCDKCHRKVEFIMTRDNAEQFKQLGLNLYGCSGDWKKGVELVLKFRRDI